MNQPSVRRRNFKTPVLAAITLTILSACVTVNVHFPESSVQRAADDYVRELYQSKEKGSAKPGAEATTPPKKTGDGTPHSRLSPRFELIPSAWADADFKVNSPRAQEILARQKSRIGDLDKYKQKGVIGETKDGLILLKDSSKLKRLEMKKIDDLIVLENQDREALYADIVDTNGANRVLPELVRKTFSRSFQGLSPTGTWIEDESSAWNRKP